MILIASFGRLSGGHFNPAVTLGVMISGEINPLLGILYWVNQLSGGFAGAWLARACIHRNVYFSLDNCGLTQVTDKASWDEVMLGRRHMVFFHDFGSFLWSWRGSLVLPKVGEGVEPGDIWIPKIHDAKAWRKFNPIKGRQNEKDDKVLARHIKRVTVSSALFISNVLLIWMGKDPCLWLFNVSIQAFIMEIVMTFFLVTTVLHVAVDTDKNVLAPLAIGLTVAVDILAG